MGTHIYSRKNDTKHTPIQDLLSTSDQTLQHLCLYELLVHAALRYWCMRPLATSARGPNERISHRAKASLPATAAIGHTERAEGSKRGEGGEGGAGLGAGLLR